MKRRGNAGNAGRSASAGRDAGVSVAACAGRTRRGGGMSTGFCTHLGVSVWSRQKVSGSRQNVYSDYGSEVPGAHTLIGMNGFSRSLRVRVLSLTIIATDALALVMPT